jgi:hypothetical protein
MVLLELIRLLWERGRLARQSSACDRLRARCPRSQESSLLAALAEEFFKRRIDVFLIVNAHADEPLLMLQAIFED